jgi:hypothetical protein
MKTVTRYMAYNDLREYDAATTVRLFTDRETAERNYKHVQPVDVPVTEPTEYVEPTERDAARRCLVTAWTAEGHYDYGMLLAVVPETPRFLVYCSGMVKRHAHCKMRLDQRQ